MILSTSHNFLFVHVPKTAGTALTEALSPFGLPSNRSIWRSILRRLPVVEPAAQAYLRKHDSAAKIRAKLGPAVYDRFHSFTVVRNPFDHAVSHFEFMKEFRIEKVAARIRAMTFEEYLDYRRKPPFWNDTFFARQPNQSWFLTAPEGALLVDRVMYFESLNADFDALVADLGLTGAELRHINRTKAKSEKRPYADYYDATTTEMVLSYYSADFDLLGYSRDIGQRAPVLRAIGRRHAGA
jgi:Sulfotransferase family